MSMMTRSMVMLALSLPWSVGTTDNGAMNFLSHRSAQEIVWAGLLCAVTCLGCDGEVVDRSVKDASVASGDAHLLDADLDDAGEADVEGMGGADGTASATVDAGADEMRSDSEAPGDTSVPTEAHRLDDELTLKDVQALGTHNSYHIQPEIPLDAWAYTHLPLDEQLGEQGVRQFELDIYYDVDRGGFDVYHIFAIDQETTCETLSDCLMTLKSWSDGHRAHHPLLILIEVKGFNPEARHSELLRDLERVILSAWTWERILHPDIVQRDADNLRDAIQTRGWPSLGSVRGRAMFVLHDGGGLRSVYTEDQTTTSGRVLFPDSYGDIDSPVAAYHSINNPLSGFDRIQEVVRAGHLVRTRADADSQQATAVDYRQFEAALGSGAHFISTDYPFPGDAERYGVTIPDGSPSRCNPLVAPAMCRSLDIEDPALVSP